MWEAVEGLSSWPSSAEGVRCRGIRDSYFHSDICISYQLKLQL